MYGLRDIISLDKLTFRVIQIEEKEFKYLDGFGPNNRYKATKIDRIPTSLISDTILKSKEDFIKLVPFTKDDEFNSTDFSKRTKLKIDDARKALLTLTELGIVKRVGKRGNNIIYKLEVVQ